MAEGAGAQESGIIQRSRPVGDAGYTGEQYAIEFAQTGLTGVNYSFSPVGSFQWTSSTKNAVIESVYCRSLYSEATGFSAAGRVYFLLYHVTSFTVARSGGTDRKGTAISLDSANGATAAADIRFSTGAALTAGTVTLGDPFGGVDLRVPADETDTNYMLNQRIDYFSGGEINKGLTIRENEGFEIYAGNPDANGIVGIALGVRWREYTK